ncbi:MAG: hypothetical protein PHS49_03710 [Candidatus Gracilibacteria bacterium]|nr:hypothetical protein [Candidatus Gracilibacteria bacterium]
MVESTKNKKTVKKVSAEVVKENKTTKKVTTDKSETKKLDTKDTTKVLKTKPIKESESSKKTTKKSDSKTKSAKVSKNNEIDTKIEKLVEELPKTTKKKPTVDKLADVKTEKVTKKSEKNDKIEIKEEKLAHKSSDNHTHKKSTSTSMGTKCTFLKYTFLDVAQLYKNFFHWNFSKITIMLWSIVLGFLSIIPIIILFFVYSFFSDVSMMELLKGMITGSLLNDFVGNTIMMLIVAIFYVVYSYSNILLINVNNSYLDKSSLPVKQNEYFKFKKIVKYFNLSIINFLILLIPFLSFAILIGLLFLFSGSLNEVYEMVSNNPFNYFSILSLIFLALSGALLVYLFYRVIFSFFVFSDNTYDHTNAKIITYIKESFNKTRKISKFFKFLLILVIFIAITVPFKFVGMAIKQNVQMFTDYSIYKNLNEDQKEYVDSTNPYYYEKLVLELQSFDDKTIANKLKINEVYLILFTILNFLFLNGLFLMIYTSFYKRELQ